MQYLLPLKDALPTDPLGLYPHLHSAAHAFVVDT